VLVTVNSTLDALDIQVLYRPEQDQSTIWAASAAAECACVWEHLRFRMLAVADGGGL
jgi:hypothetical protein